MRELKKESDKLIGKNEGKENKDFPNNINMVEISRKRGIKKVTGIMIETIQEKEEKEREDLNRATIGDKFKMIKTEKRVKYLKTEKIIMEKNDKENREILMKHKENF